MFWGGQWTELIWLSCADVLLGVAYQALPPFNQVDIPLPTSTLPLPLVTKKLDVL